MADTAQIRLLRARNGLSRIAVISMLNAGAALLGSSAAQAQEAAAPAEPEIIVTAQRRAESAQDIPISINVIAGAAAKAQGVTDTLDLSGRVPSLTISDVGSKLYFLRGVGTTGANINQEQSVASYLDGVYLYSSWASVVPVGSTARVEVLKGPQGTLFGRNTTGGVIQFVTRDPLAEETLEAEMGYGNYKTMTGNFYGAVKLADNVGVSLSVDYRDQGNGWGRNTIRNEDSYFRNYTSVQGKIAAELTESTKVTALGWYVDSDTSGLETQVFPGVISFDGQVSNPGRYEVRSDSANFEKSHSWFGYLKLEQDVGFADFVSLTSYRDVTNHFNLDQDSTPVTVVNALLIQPAKAFSQELQLVSKPDSPINWMVGGYLFRAKAGYEPITIAGLAAGAFPQIEITNTQKTYSEALFGQVTVPLGESTKVTGGLRYTWEKARKVNHALYSQSVLIFTNPNDKAFSNGWTWRLAVDQKLSSDILAYASYNRGLKSGGFDLVTPTPLPAYKPEKLDAFEVGLKTQLFDRKVTFNVAAFLYKFRDIQVQRIIPGGTATENAAKATLKGIDAELTVRVTPTTRVNGTAALLDGEYKKFPNATGYFASPLAGPAFTFDASGKRTVYTPGFSGNAGITQDILLGSSKLTLDGNVTYIGDQYVGPDNRAEVKSRALVNASLQWTSADEKVHVRLWAKNLFDKEYINNILVSGVGDIQQPGEPRTYGITLGTKL